MAGVDERPVLIAGAGIAGLTAALALRSRGVEAIVLERQPDLPRHASALQIWSTGVKALRELGLGEELERVAREVRSFRFSTWRGRPLFTLPIGEIVDELGAPPTVMVRRSDLLDLLVGGLEDGAIRFGTECVGYRNERDAVVALLADGSEERGSILVGTDGTESAIRRQLAPDATPRFAGYQYLRALTTFDGVPEFEFAFSMGRGDRFLLHDLGGGSVYWAGVLVAKPGSGDPPEGRKAQLSARFRDFHEPIPSLIEATDEAAIYRTDIQALAHDVPWLDGRVVLVGDAAHATTPNLGRGASEAIVDAVVLARLLGEHDDPAEALARYERERRPVTAAVQKRSWRIGRAASWSNPVACAFREQLMKRAMSRGMAQGTRAELEALAS